MTSDAWSSLRATIEQFSHTVRFIGNCNYIENVPEPILSRFNCISLLPQGDEETAEVKEETYQYVEKLLTALNIEYAVDDVKLFVDLDFPDIRTTVKKIQQIKNAQYVKLDVQAIRSTFECADILQLMFERPDPKANYEYLLAKYSNSVVSAMQGVSKTFPKYVVNNMPQYIDKLPLMVCNIAKYNDMLTNALDQFIVLLAMVYNIQMVVAQNS